MKTIRNKNTGEIRRAENKEANNLVDAKFLGWEFIPKSVWKTEVRGEVKKSEGKVQKTENNSENLSDKKVRKQRREEKRQRYENKKS